MIKKLFSNIEKIWQKTEDSIEEWRRLDQARKVEAETHRDELWAEATENEKLLAEAIREEEAQRASVREDTGRQRFVFVAHSKAASETLGVLAGERYRLVNTVPDGGSTGVGVKGSWLVFEAPLSEPPSESSRHALQNLDGSIEAIVRFLR